MEKVFEMLSKPIIDKLGPTWTSALAAIALLIVLGPRLIDIRRNFLDERAGRRRLEIEKTRLEVLKLHYEIEKLRKKHPLQDIEDVLLQPPTPLEPEPDEPEMSRIPRWFTKHMGLSKVLLLAMEALLAFPMILFAVSTISIPVLFFAVDGVDPKVALVAIIYASITWFFYVGFAKVRRLRNRLGLR